MGAEKGRTLFCGSPGHSGTGFHVFFDSRSCRNHGLIPDREVIDQAGLPSDHDPLTDRRTTRDAHLGDDDPVFSHGHVMGDLDQVVDFCALPDECGSERGPVDSHVGSDFDVIFNDDDASLWNFMMTAFVLNVSESVTSNHGSGVDNDPGAYPASVLNTHVRMKYGILTDGDAFSQKDTGVEGDPIPESRMMANGDKRSDGRVAAQAYVRAFHDVFGDSGRGERFCEKLVNQPDKIKLRVRRDQLSAVQIGKILGNDES